MISVRYVVRRRERGSRVEVIVEVWMVGRRWEGGLVEKETEAGKV